MKFPAAMAASLAIVGLTSSSAFAAADQGAIKFTWTIPVTFTAHIASNYASGTSAFTTVGAGTIQASTPGTGTCTTPSGDAVGSYTLSFGNISPDGTHVLGCNYQDAIGISVATNDANGYKVYETLDVTTAPTNYGLCINTNGTTATATLPATTHGTAFAGGTFVANVLTGCAGSGILVGPGTATISNAGTGGDVGGAGASSTTVPTTGAIFTVAAGTPASGTNFYGEDIQLNVPPTAPSVTAAAHAIIIYFVPG